VEEASSALRDFMKWLLLTALGLFTYGAYCLVQAPRVREQAQAVPRMSCNQLVQNGPGASRYVALTDAHLSDGKSISERDGDTGALELYHPIYAAHLQQEPDPHGLRLVLCILDEVERRRIRDDRDQRQRLGQPGLSELTGEVQAGADQLPPWARQGLTEKYRGLSLDKCWVLIVGRYEPTAIRAASFVQHSVVSLLVAAALLLAWWIWGRAAPAAIAADGREQAPALDDLDAFRE
jgi:hypothetical protein